MSSSFVTTIDVKLAPQMIRDLESQGFEIHSLAHAFFSAKKKALSCTLYHSGKLVVQGKEMASFIEFYLEPEILKSFSYSHPTAEMNLTPRIGIDESGKGDFFGPLCIAGVYVTSDQFSQLQAIGVKDSKKLTDVAIKKLAKQIQSICDYHIVKINPQKYNEIYAKFKNLNTLLAWGHATAIEQLVQKTGCTDVVIDQFAHESVVKVAVNRKKIDIELTQRHRAEDDLAVAAASILARNTFVESLEKMSHDIGMTLPKGCSTAVQKAGREILQKKGLDALKNVCKEHFKTFNLLIQNEPHN